MKKPRDLLVVNSLTKQFDQLTAVDNVSLTIREGTITGLIGPNGAGKTTLFNVLAGETRSSHGQIVLNNMPIHHLQTDEIYKAGMARTFQIPQPFPEMTVLDNLLVAAPKQIGETLLAPIFKRSAIRQQERAHLDRAMDILHFTTLENVAHKAASQLSGGQQKLLELARVLMGKPQLILLDEPAAGVNPALTDVLLEKIHALNDRGMTFLIIEHNMDLIMQHCHPIIAMANGQVIFEGSALEALNCETLLDSYLGDTNT